MKSPLFLRLARPYVKRKLRRQFSDVRLSGRERLELSMKSGPIILACNHVAWWDPLLLVHLDSVLGTDGYCLMDKENLDKLPFFRWAGALPIDRSSRRMAYSDLRRAGGVLRAAGDILAIFPQGEQRPAHLPLSLRPGVAALAASSLVPVVPLAIRYDYGESPRPLVHMAVGDAVRFTRDSSTRESFLTDLEEKLNAALVDIDQELLLPTGKFESLLGRRVKDEERGRIPLGAAALKVLTKGGAS